MRGSKDAELWSRAGQAGFLLVTKDGDFHRLSVMLGPPPKVIWVRLGNCTTREILELLLRERDTIARFHEDSDSGFLAIG